jgi:hypothetical protein
MKKLFATLIDCDKTASVSCKFLPRTASLTGKEYLYSTQSVFVDIVYG